MQKSEETHAGMKVDSGAQRRLESRAAAAEKVPAYQKLYQTTTVASK